MAFLYSRVLKPILFLFDAEFIHEVFISVGEFLGRFRITRKIVSIFYGYRGGDISRTIDGITYKSPILLSAGFDYNGRLTQILSSVGFGGEEVGSVTARPCAGNPKPRLTRLKKSKGILVYKGLRNDGVEVVMKRLKARRATKDFIVGVSIAKTNDEVCATVEGGIEDYLYSYRRLNEESAGDYYAINISCPNSFGGETFTTAPLLEKLLSALSTIKTNKPVYLKMPINLEWNDFESLIDVAKKFSFIRGFIIGNLNKNYSELDFTEEAPKEYRGGVSGKATFARSNNLIQKTRAKVGKSMTIWGCGGILSADDAEAKTNAGADAIQLITGMIFTGPHLVKNICHAIAKKQK